MSFENSSLRESMQAISNSCWSIEDSTLNNTTKPTTSEHVPPLELWSPESETETDFTFAEADPGEDKKEPPKEPPKEPETTERGSKSGEDKKGDDLKRAFRAMAYSMRLGDLVGWITDQMVKGEPDKPGEPSYPNQDKLSETFRRLNRIGFTNKQIVDKVNSQLELEKSPLRLKLEEDAPIARLGVTSNDKIVIPSEPIITNDEAFDKEQTRVKDIAAKCATSFNAGDHKVDHFLALVKDATKNGIRYHEFLSKVDDALKSAKGPYRRLMATTDGSFLLQHDREDRSVWIFPAEAKK